uniref:ShKT domain-containing protein n=1 Tax=Plectus sambesii TaxID=2011161 RepID=A0A914V334_9BILA
MQFLLLAICSTQLTLAQDCGMAPTPVFAVICEQLQRWDVATRRLLRLGPSAGPQTMPPGIPFEMQGLWQPEFNNNQVQQPVPRSPYSCMDLSCLCQFLNGQISPDGACFLNSGQRLTQVVRKEYRRLTDDERSRFHDALNQLKQNGEYHNFARIHTQMSDSGGAHSGPAFLPWHREFTKRLEIALRMIDPEVALPYWDSVLDRNLPDARDSVLWTSEFFGESDSAGNVINGPYANWRTLEGRSTIQRHLARQGSLLTEDQLNTFYQKSNIASVLAHTTPAPNCPFRLDFTALEYVHGNVHFWVGGDMLEQSTSANDPTFYLHHSFVDLIWEQWRQQRQSRWERENDFPEDIAVCSNEQHFRDSEMRPFDGIRNFHGLSNTYTDELYTFEPRPSCANDEQDCRSDYLFCDRSHGRPKCVSKVKLGGRCDGFERENICYDGICRNGRCVESRSSVTATPAKSKTTRRPAPRRKKPAAAFNNCFNEHPCCASWAAKGECSKNPRFMNKQCQPSCNKCRPSFDVSK